MIGEKWTFYDALAETPWYDGAWWKSSPMLVLQSA
jgi:hypothetical protein